VNSSRRSCRNMPGGSRDSTSLSSRCSRRGRQPVKSSSICRSRRQFLLFGPVFDARVSYSCIYVSTARGDDGTPTGPATFPQVTAHQLRHSAASLMIASGTHVKTIQRQLGHKSAVTTLDQYRHLFENDLADVADQMGQRPPGCRIWSKCGHGSRPDIKGPVTCGVGEAQRSCRETGLLCESAGRSIVPTRSGQKKKTRRPLTCGFPKRGAAGNRTRVLRRFSRASPCAVRLASARISRSCEPAEMTIPVAVRCPVRLRDRGGR
jgi:Phage integrase family